MAYSGGVPEIRVLANYPHFRDPVHTRSLVVLICLVATKYSLVEDRLHASIPGAKDGVIR